MRNLQSPLSYVGVEAATPPNFTVETRVPKSSDYKSFNLGDIWLEKGTTNIWILTSKAQSIATWTLLNNAGSSTFEDVTITPDDLTITDGDLYINNGGLVFGAINFRSSLRTLADGTVYGLPDGNDGELLIGGTGLTPAWGNIVSSGGTVTITNSPNGINIEAAGGTAANTYTTDDGNAVSPDGAGNVNIIGGSNIGTTGAIANTITLNLDDNVIIPGNLTVNGNTEITNDLTVNGNLNSYLNINTQAGNYILVLTDAGKEIQMTSAVAATLTIPAQGTVAFPVGTQVIVTQYGAGTITVIGAGAVTINSISSKVDTYEQYSAVALILQDATGDGTWLLAGDLK